MKAKKKRLVKGIESNISFHRIVEAYNEYCRDNNIRHPNGFGSYQFYENMIKWLAKQGCQYHISEEKAFTWESQSKQVEFVLRYGM